MSTTTDGQICFGIAFEEEFEFPWKAEQFDGDIEDWWRFTNLYKEPFEIYDDNDPSGYAGGVKPSEEKILEYYTHRREWLKANQLPVVEVNYCSCDYPIYMLAVPSSVKNANRGNPLVFKPEELQVTPKEQLDLMTFCINYEIEIGDSNPEWYLSSYWG